MAQLHIPSLPSSSSSTRIERRHITIPLQSSSSLLFSSWKALLFYQYTGRIALKKLSSLKDPLIPKDVDPLACSPKSMYRIAEKVSLVLTARYPYSMR